MVQHLADARHGVDELARPLLHRDIATVVIWVAAMVFLAIAASRGTPTDHGRKDLAFLRSLGLATYPLYLVHFAPGIMLLHGAAAIGLPPGSALIAVLVLLTAFAVFVANSVEPILRQAIRSVFNRFYDHGRSYPVLASVNRPNITIMAGKRDH